MSDDTGSFSRGFGSPEHLLQAIVDSSDDAIVSKDLNGIVTSWNRGAERIFGYSAPEIIGKHISLLIPKERLEEEPLILEQLRRGERVDHFETQRVRKDGEIREISLTISPVRDITGQVVGASKIARDITAQKKAALAIAEANEETARQGRMKDEFLATLSHELRTPLQSILGWVQLLLAGDMDPEELKEGLHVIKRNAQSQQRIIEDLLDMNRILSGKIRIEVERVELGPILEAAMETVKPAADAKSIRMHAVLDGLPKLVHGDPQRLHQVFWNLLNNAIKFTPRAGRIEVLLQRVNSHFEVSVADSGVGITEDFLPYVFDRFRQADASSTRTHGGLGLGLAIVKHLVELHGGSVVAKSAGPGRGATFAVRLPVAALKEGEVPLGRASAPSTELPNKSLPQLAGLSVLVVEDDEDSRDLLARTLENAGATVTTACSADEGLLKFETLATDVIVSDIGMPEKNGYMFIEAIRSKPAQDGGKVPAVALTAYSRVEDRVRALCAGFQILLPKPADSSELVVTVAALAKQFR
jgi:PAS domain S-box-containing protein